MKETIAVELYSLAWLCQLYDCYVSIYITISSVLFRSRKREKKKWLQLYFLFVEMHLIAGVGGVFIKFNFLIKSNFLFASQLRCDKGFAAGASHREDGIVGLTSSCQHWGTVAPRPLSTQQQWAGQDRAPVGLVLQWGWRTGLRSTANLDVFWARTPLATAPGLHRNPTLPPSTLSAQLGAFMRDKTVIADSFSSSNFSFQNIPRHILFKWATVRWAAVMLQTWDMGRPGWLSPSGPMCSCLKRMPCHGCCTSVTDIQNLCWNREITEG